MGRNGRKGRSRESSFYTCSSCFGSHKVVYPYDSASDSGFICRCGGRLRQFSEYEATLLFNTQ